MKTLFIIFVLCALLKCFSCFFEQYAGQFYLRFRGLELCKNPGRHPDRAKFRLLKISRDTFKLELNVSVPYDIDNDLYVQVSYVNRGNYGHQWNAVLNKTDKLCDFSKKYYHGFSEGLFSSINMTFTCPIKKGRYNMFLLFKEPICNFLEKIPVLPYGHYRATTSYLRKTGGELSVESCHNFYIEVRPIMEVRHQCKEMSLI